ncbi:MAG: tetratricopeptide repeat protein [Desulfuromusa sp.]|nr:tetratricopeptide repeat protein [Desulfuromusa sp.]
MTDKNQQSLLLGKIAAYTEILVKDPSSTIFVSLAETYRKMGMLEDARQIISKGLDLHPEFGPAYIVLARGLCQLGDFDGSCAAFERALDFDAESLAALVGYARVQILLENEDAARELLLRARKLSPADPVINKLILSLPEKSEAMVEEADELDEQSDELEDVSVSLVSPTLADLYLSQGLPERALEIYQQLSTQNPDDLTLRRRVKELEAQLGDEEQNVIDESAISSNQEDEQSPLSDRAVVEPVHDTNGVSALETLNQWLANIEQRRGNV